MSQNELSSTGPGDDLFNPATGLPMVGGEFGSVDVAGNPFGLDLQSHLSDVSLGCDFGTSFSSMDTGFSWD